MPCAKSFFATLQCELLDRRRFKPQAEARMALFEFIEGFYNPHRRHSSIGYLSPIDFERHLASNRPAITGACECHDAALDLGGIAPVDRAQLHTQRRRHDLDGAELPDPERARPPLLRLNADLLISH
jgi:hypothetical protein